MARGSMGLGSSHIGDCRVRGVWSWLGQAWFVWLLNRIPTRWGKGRHLYESGWGLKGGWGPLLSLVPYMFWEWNFWNWRLTTFYYLLYSFFFL